MSALAERLLLCRAQILYRVSALVCFSRVSSTNWFARRVSVLGERSLVCRAQIVDAVCRLYDSLSVSSTNWFYRVSVLA